MSRIYAWMISLSPILCLRVHIWINDKTIIDHIGNIVGNTKLYYRYANSLYHPAIGAFLEPAYMSATLSSVVIMTLITPYRFLRVDVSDKSPIYTYFRGVVRYVIDVFVVAFICVVISLTAYRPEFL